MMKNYKGKFSYCLLTLHGSDSASPGQKLQTLKNTTNVLCGRNCCFSLIFITLSFHKNGIPHFYLSPGHLQIKVIWLSLPLHLGVALRLIFDVWGKNHVYNFSDIALKGRTMSISVLLLICYLACHHGGLCVQGQPPRVVKNKIKGTWVL